MSKLTRGQRIEIYNRRKAGATLRSLSKIYDIGVSSIIYLVSLIDYHGIDILRVDKNQYYSPELKIQIIHCVLIRNKSIHQTAIEFGLPNVGILANWIKKYKELGYNIVEKPKGRPTMKKPKSIEQNDNKTTRRDTLLKSSG